MANTHVKKAKKIQKKHIYPLIWFITAEANNHKIKSKLWMLSRCWIHIGQ